MRRFTWVTAVTVLALGGPGCGKTPEPEPDPGASGSGGSAGAAAKTWPYQLYLSPNNLTNYGIQVDDKYVYWFTGARIFRASKTGEGEPYELIVCTLCHPFHFQVDKGYLYLHLSSYLLRVDRETGASTQVDLLWDHVASGGLGLDERYVYSAMPGCAAITRVDRETMTFDEEADVMYIDTEYPRTAGSTEIVRAGSRLVCGQPEKLFVIDEWGEEARLVREGVHELTGLIGIGEDAYWMERGALGRIGPDGEPVVLTDGVLSFERLSYVPSLGRIVWGQGTDIRSFSLEAQALDPLAEKTVAGNDVAVDDQAAYTTASAPKEPPPRSPSGNSRTGSRRSLFPTSSPPSNSAPGAWRGLTLDA